MKIKCILHMERLISYTNILTYYNIKLPYREFHFRSVNVLMCSKYNKFDVIVCNIDILSRVYEYFVV
jgi:hypothetical protein